MLYSKTVRMVACAFALMSSQAMAEQRPVVVELFTSQGCSSCPPADELLREIGQRDDVIALALHVDYWDYIGWKDRFGNPAHAHRQRAYAAAGGRRSIYTPEMVINGEKAIVGARPMKLADAIMDVAKQPLQVKLTTERDGEKLRVTAQPLSPLDGPFEVKMVTITPEHQQKITRGENRGRTIIYSNIVREWKALGQWQGSAEESFGAAAPEGQPCVILVQEPGSGKIVAAARVN